MLKYGIIEIFTNEEARWQGKPLGEAVIQYVHSLKIAARCLVMKGTEGCYESGEIATRRLEILSMNMPVQILIILPANELSRVLPHLREMLTDGIMTVRDAEVICHKSKKSLIPKQIKVRDVMTPSPRTVEPSTPINEVVQLLLGSIFTGVPVVDENRRPVGVISQGDLIYRAGMPLRLCLLAGSDQDRLDVLLKSLSGKNAREIMTQPAIIIDDQELLTEAVRLMLQKNLKRLPVVDASGKLVGILSRMDIFRTVMETSPDWKSFGELHNIEIGNARFVSDIMRRDIHAVLPRTPVEEILGIIDDNDIQRIAVVDAEGRFLGLISDEDLLSAFSEHRSGLWDFLVSKMTFTEAGRKHKELMEKIQARTASDVMDSHPATVLEDTPLEEAIVLMSTRGLKRLPVLDASGVFKGMISRESLLRTGFAHC